MKKILLLLLTIFHVFLWGQGGQAEYKVEFKNFNAVITHNIQNNSSNSEMHIFMYYEDGSRDEIFYKQLLNDNPGNSTYNYSNIYTTPKKPVGIRYYMFINWIKQSSNTEVHEGDYFRTTDICTPIHVVEYFPNAENSDHFDPPFNYDLRFLPVHTLISENLPGTSQPNTILPSDDKVNLYAKQGFAANLYHYQYSVDNVNWIDIDPSLFTLNKLSVSAKDLFGNNYSQYLGQNIYFRAASCLSNGVYEAVSSPVVLTLLKSAPHIPTNTVSPTKCSDTSDGSITLNFDRTLIAGENLKVSLLNTDTGAAVDLSNSGFPNGDLTPFLQTNTTLVIPNLQPGKYKLGLLGTYNANATYTDASSHTVSFEITKPTPVTFSMTSQTNVYCFQGNDGNISLTAGGGQNQYQYLVTKDGQPYVDWTNFSSGNTTIIQGLNAGIYKIKVRDSNLCVAKDNGSEKEITVTITQPSQAIAFPAAETEVSQPTGYGLSNGYISVRVIGGTPNADGSYNFEWRKDTPSGTVITSGITTDAVNNPYTIKLDGLPAGTYYLTVKDKNYSVASSQLGNCGIISQEFIVNQPDPLVANIQLEKQISCNIANNYQFKPDVNNNGIPDEAEDGILKAVVTGGVGSYTYQWQILNNGLFQDIPGANQVTLDNLTTGTYKVLVKDSKNNTTDAQYVLVFPSELAITLAANTISCYGQNGGQVSVTATGGTGAYSYQWNTNDTTPTVTGLSAGNYFVLVNDAKNCKVSGSVQIQGPNQLAIDDILVQNPICYGAANGEIKISVSGGKAPYTIAWTNGITGENNTGLVAGQYTVTVTDANGCSIFRQYTLTDPVQLTVDLGKDRTLCLGDTQTYNVTITDPAATYQWKDQNGNIISTDPFITISAAGTYTILITDSKGCTATDTVVIKNSSEVLNPQFMLTTHAYREATVVLVNTSPTKPETVEWVIPNTPDIQVINKTDDFIELKFLQLGAYEIGLKGTQGECEKIFYKKVIVEENTTGVNLNPEKASNVREFTILPNPNNGIFSILVGLDKAAIINVRIIDMVSHEAYPAVKKTPSTYFTIPYNTSLPAGSYLIILETGNEALVKRMLVQ
ncbi:putative secreted protein (Por secretion system target) [Chryseobacterium sp. 7]|uniref:SprB repeat-containing protein n=1 Tax=Chryseobacterium sp. 7 TaxID=2035214 RepID=UPI000EAC1684|nr:SprB repeat-containing protein [Chryseobacterium sp. 7]RLJ33280.1 putative secreted protein (Por secretion system target) [Chryseobacterium sp. 7]